MSEAAAFAAALGHIFDVLGEDAWLTRRANTRAAVKAVVTVPDRDDLLNDAPMSLANRLIDLSSTAGALTGDIVSIDESTYILGRSAEPDNLGLSSRWIGVPLTLSVGTLAYHADGYPLVVWNGVEWVSTP